MAQLGFQDRHQGVSHGDMIGRVVNPLCEDILLKVLDLRRHVSRRLLSLIGGLVAIPASREQQSGDHLQAQRVMGNRLDDPTGARLREQGAAEQLDERKRSAIDTLAPLKALC